MVRASDAGMRLYTSLATRKSSAISFLALAAAGFASLHGAYLFTIKMPFCFGKAFFMCGMSDSRYDDIHYYETFVHLRNNRSYI